MTMIHLLPDMNIGQIQSWVELGRVGSGQGIWTNVDLCSLTLDRSQRQYVKSE